MSKKKSVTASKKNRDKNKEMGLIPKNCTIPNNPKCRRQIDKLAQEQRIEYDMALPRDYAD